MIDYQQLSADQQISFFICWCHTENWSNAEYLALSRREKFFFNFDLI